MLNQLLETWQIDHRVNFVLIDAISEPGMASTLSTRGGRDVARQFAHMHNVRLGWLEAYRKDLAKDVGKFASKGSPSKSELKKAHTASTHAIAEMFRRTIEKGGPMKGWKRGPICALGYFIAHESHHRGSILLTLKQSGHTVSQDVAYGIWDWNRI